MVCPHRNAGPDRTRRLTLVHDHTHDHIHDHLSYRPGEYIAAFTALEGKVIEKAKAIGADYTIVRAGTLKVQPTVYFSGV